MDHLPKHIADMVGILLDGPTVAQERGTMSPGLQVLDGDDGVSTVKYGDLVMGWVNQIKLDRREGMTYRAMTPTGSVRHCWSMNMAKAWLIEEAI